MKKISLLAIAILLFSSHDMFLKQSSHFLAPNTDATIQLFNGTFAESDNIITRDRMIDASLVGKGKRIPIDTSQWTDEGKTTVLKFTTGEAGTWVAGVSTRARNIEMDSEAFNRYLEHDGVLDMLTWRKENDAMGEAAVEKYSKHVKTIFQVGEERTEDWKTELGYPIEFIPLSNPYDLNIGDELPVRLLFQGAPLVNQLVYAGSDAAHDHSHNHDHADGEDHDHTHGTTQLRTDENGELSMKVDAAGEWYLRTINLVLSEEEGLTHESNWATLTFEVKENGKEVKEKQIADNQFNGMPSYVYWIGGLLMFLVLFLIFRKKS
ncbi:MAG: DUF4198 domain-containing protein [Bacteroidota bacterium]